MGVSEPIQVVKNMLFELRHSWVPQDVETTYRHTRKIKALEYVIEKAERVEELERELDLLTMVITNSSHADELQADYERLKGAESNDDQS